MKTPSERASRAEAPRARRRDDDGRDRPRTEDPRDDEDPQDEPPEHPPEDPSEPLAAHQLLPLP
ncbi:hypothetical protein ABZ934_24795, partial [Streptomyces sp. NPDC046557]